MGKEELQISKPNVDGGELKCIKGCLGETPKGCPKTCTQDMTGCLCNMFSLWQGSVIFLFFDLIWSAYWTFHTIDPYITGKGNWNFYRICWLVVGIAFVVMLVGSVFGVLGMFKQNAQWFKWYVLAMVFGTIAIFVVFTIIFILAILDDAHKGGNNAIGHWVGCFYRWWMYVVTNSYQKVMEGGGSGKSAPGEAAV